LRDDDDQHGPAHEQLVVCQDHHAQRLVAILQLRSKWVPSSNLLGRPRGVIGLSPVCRGGFRIQGIPKEHDKWELCAGVLAVQVALPRFVVLLPHVASSPFPPDFDDALRKCLLQMPAGYQTGYVPLLARH